MRIYAHVRRNNADRSRSMCLCLHRDLGMMLVSMEFEGENLEELNQQPSTSMPDRVI